MNLLHLPWLELAIAVALVGSPCVSRLRDPDRAYRWGLAFTGAVVRLHVPGLAGLLPRASRPSRSAAWSVQPCLFGRQVFAPRRARAPRWCRRSPCCTS